MYQTRALERIPIYRAMDGLPISTSQWLILLPFLMAIASALFWFGNVRFSPVVGETGDLVAFL